MENGARRHGAQRRECLDGLHWHVELGRWHRTADLYGGRCRYVWKEDTSCDRLHHDRTGNICNPSVYLNLSLVLGNARRDWTRTGYHWKRAFDA